MEPSQPIDPEPLVSYVVPSYVISTRLNMELVHDPLRPEYASDEPPLVRAECAPSALSKMRVSIPRHILDSMEDIEITPNSEQLRGRSLAITSHMAPGWIGASSRAKQARKELRDRRQRRAHNGRVGRPAPAAAKKSTTTTTTTSTTNSTTFSTTTSRGRKSLSLHDHCNFPPGYQSLAASHSASMSAFKELKDPFSALPSSPGRKVPVPAVTTQTFTDDLAGPAPGAWGNARSRSFDSFQEKTKRLIAGGRLAHVPVVHRVAVM